MYILEEFSGIINYQFVALRIEIVMYHVEVWCLHLKCICLYSDFNTFCLEIDSITISLHVARLYLQHILLSHT